MSSKNTFIIASRGSSLALAQAGLIRQQCAALFKDLRFEIKIIKTTGDKLQSQQPDASESLPKGLFTKEIEEALLAREADLAVHSLKDLPTELPDGLLLGATPRRQDVRDVLIYRSRELASKQESSAADVDWRPGAKKRRGFAPHLAMRKLPIDSTVGTSSARREAQLKFHAPGISTALIRGNVGTRIQKLHDLTEFDAIILAAAGIHRLGFRVNAQGKLAGEGIPPGLLLSYIDAEEMLPCVGQGALGVEMRNDDEQAARICAQLNHIPTQLAVTAERAFLKAMGGGCQSPVGAYARVLGHKLEMIVAGFEGGRRSARGSRPMKEAALLGEELARNILG